MGDPPGTRGPARRSRRLPRAVLPVDVWNAFTRSARSSIQTSRGRSARLSRTEVSFFVYRVVEATPRVRAWAGRPSPRASFDDLLRSIPDLNLAAPSDYGRVFFQSLPVLSRSAGRHALLVVPRAARRNHRDPPGPAFRDLAGRCRRRLCLYPGS